MSKKRLVELMSTIPCNNKKCGYECNGRCVGDFDWSCQKKALADYLLANGVIVPLCKVGDKVYIKVRKEKHPFKVTHISITKNGTYYEADRIRNKKETLLYLNDTTTAVFDDAEIGKTVFLTREEAEKKLEEGNNEV